MAEPLQRVASTPAAAGHHTAGGWPPHRQLAAAGTGRRVTAARRTGYALLQRPATRWQRVSVLVISADDGFEARVLTGGKLPDRSIPANIYRIQ